MLKINTTVLTSDGGSVTTGSLVKVIPDFGQIKPVKNEKDVIISYSLPTYNPIYRNQEAIDKDFAPLVVVKDMESRQMIYSLNVSLSPAEFENPTKAVIEEKVKICLGEIYGITNIEIIS